MEIIIRNEINSKDWKNFIKWADEEKFLLKDTNFFTQLFSINGWKMEDHLLDFFLYNEHVLKGEYEFEWPTWLKELKGSKIEKTIKNFFGWFKGENPEWEIFIEFYFELIKYLNKEGRDADKEYELALMMNEFTKGLRESGDKDYNNIVIYINEHTHKWMKGYKE